MTKTKYKTKQAVTNKVYYRHPKNIECILCGSRLECIGTNHRQLTSLEEKSKVTIQIRRCRNKACSNHKSNLKPISYQHQIVFGSSYGIDVHGLIGHMRLAHRQTVPEIHQELTQGYAHIEIGERHVENIVNQLSLCIEQSGKNANHLRDYFSEQSGLVLSIDGVEPEKGHNILYIVREVISGKILFAHYATYTDAVHLKAEILLPLKRVLEQAALPVLGWIADKELAIGTAVQEVFKEVPFQHCQAHFLAAMKSPLTKADTQLGKSVKKNFGKIKPIERAIDRSYQADELELVEKEQLQTLCMTIRNWLNTSMSHKYRFKGLELYESMEQILQLISVLRQHKEHSVLEQLQKSLKDSLADLRIEQQALKQGQNILDQLTDLLYGAKNEKKIRPTQEHKEQFTAQQIQQKVEDLLSQNHKQYKGHSSQMRGYLRHFQLVYDNWKEHLFTCYDYSYLPNDNNRIELSHSQVKKQYRRITGQKSTAKYLKIHGEQAPFLLAYTYGNNSEKDLIDLIRNTDQQQLKQQKKEQLKKSQQRAKNTPTKKRLKKTLQNIKELWCQNNNS